MDAHLEDTVTLFDDISPGLLVQDIAFDWTGKRAALAINDKTIRIYVRNKKTWSLECPIKVQGSSVWKLKWARPEHGTILAACSLDHQIRLHFRDKYEWNNMSGINMKPEDVKFSPLGAFGLNLSIVTAEGKMEFHKYQYKVAEPTVTTVDVNRYGLNCLSWSKGIEKDQSIIAVGSKSHETTPLRVFNGLKLKPEDKQVQEILEVNTLTFWDVRISSTTK